MLFLLFLISTLGQHLPEVAAENAALPETMRKLHEDLPSLNVPSNLYSMPYSPPTPLPSAEPSQPPRVPGKGKFGPGGKFGPQDAAFDRVFYHRHHGRPRAHRSLRDPQGVAAAAAIDHAEEEE